MTNLIRSMGYSLGKVHVGMITYLCELYREGNKEPFESFLSSFNLSIPSSPIPRREWNSVDLAILEKSDSGQETPNILIEVKVDDYEGGSNQQNYQTIRYASRWPSCQAYLFITLGKGEYYHPPRSNRFTWIRLRQFQKAVNAIKTLDNAITDWLNEINREIALQDNVLVADMSRLDEYRAGTWNIYLFGKMVEIIIPQFDASKTDVEPTCYTYGTRPDTILNFGWQQEPLYMEINYSGRLNLKVSLNTSVSEESRRDTIDQEIRKCKQLSFKISPKFHQGGKVGRSKTIASFDVGLFNKAGVLLCQPSINHVCNNVVSIVNTLYG
jgi:hypothetical protein